MPVAFCVSVLPLHSMEVDTLLYIFSTINSINKLNLSVKKNQNQKHD